MRATLTGLVGLLLALPVSAPGAPRAVLRINQVDVSKPPGVQLLVTDLDSSLTPVTDRKPKHYRLAVDGVPLVEADKVALFHTLNEPLALSLVIQVSPPMRDVFAEAMEACKRLVGSLPRGSKVGLLAYTDVVLQAVKPGPAADIVPAIDNLRIREDALEVDLPNAIKDALESLDDAKLPRQRLIVVFSDGLTAELNFAVFSELGRRAQDKGVVVHAVGYAPLEPARLRTLYELSKAGGGTARESKDPAEVAQAFAALQSEIRNQIRLSYTLAKFFDGKLHDFQIETPGGQVSNIVATELPKYTPKVSKAHLWYRSPLFVVALIGVGQVGLVLLVLAILRWRRRGARRADVERGRYMAALGEDDEEYEDEDEEDEEEQEDEADRGEPPPPQQRVRGREPERALEQEVRRSRRTPVPSVRQTIEDHSQNLRAQLLEPDPDLLSSSPALSGQGVDTTAPVERVAPDDLAQPAPDSTARRRRPPTDGLLLPDPEQFMRQQEQAPDSAPEPSVGLSAIPHPDDFLRQVGASIPAPANRAPPSPETGARQSSVNIIGGSGIPLPQGGPLGGPLGAPVVGMVGLPAEAGVRAGEFLNRKTKVIAIEDMSGLDYVAWIVPLDAVRPGQICQPVAIHDGFVLGEDPSRRGLFTLDASGFRLETVGVRGETLNQLLADNDHFFIGDREFVFKIATRTGMPPLPAIRLEVLDGMDEGRSVALPERQPVTIGAHPGSDLVVRGQGVEQFHAIAYRSGRVCTLSDLGTPNGIGYQGQQVGFQSIRSGDEVLFGDVRVVYSYVEPEQHVEYADDELLSTKQRVV